MNKKRTKLITVFLYFRVKNLNLILQNEKPDFENREFFNF